MFGKKKTEKPVNDDFDKVLDDIFPKVKEVATNFLEGIKNNINQKEITPKEDVDNIFERISKFASEQLDKLREAMPEKYKELKSNIEDFGGLGELAKYCWQIEIKETDQFTLEELISWAKLYLKPSKHSAACLYVLKSASPYEYHVCFLDKDNNPLLNGDDKHLVVYTNSIDKDLANALGSKDMLLLK